MYSSFSAGRVRLVAVAALAAALLVPSGCGDGGPKIVPVSGTVTIDGQPLAYGHIQVLPTGWRPASSPIDANGRFTLTTTVAGDGCAIGTHPVAILASESLSNTKMKWHTPKKYADVSTSGLTATISGPTDDLKIELTWGKKGGKPFIELLDDTTPAKEGGSENE